MGTDGSAARTDLYGWRQVLLIKWLGTHREYDKIDGKRVEYDRAGMQIRPIRTDSDHEKAVARISEVMGAALGTPEGDELDVLATLVDA